MTYPRYTGPVQEDICPDCGMKVEHRRVAVDFPDGSVVNADVANHACRGPA